jgi:hypothetical protein
MDANLILAGGLASLAMKGGVMCYNRQKKARKLYKTKLSSLVMAKGTGKSQLKKHLQSLSSELVIIDINEVVEKKNDKLDFLKKAKSYVDDVLKKFPKKRFLLLLSSQEESEYLNVDKTNTFVVCPSIELFGKIKGDFDPEQGSERLQEIEKERLGLIRDTDSDNLNIYNTFEELYGVIKSVYKLQSTF